MFDDLMQAVSGLGSRLADLTAELVELSNVNTGSLNRDGIDACFDRIVPSFADLGSVALLEVDPLEVVDDDGNPQQLALGPVLHVQSPQRTGRRVVLVGHVDTVFGPDDPFQRAEIDGETMHGPGVADMKGGLLVLRTALEVVAEAGVSLAWDVILNSDEELGSVGSAPLLAELAEGAELGFVFEPALPDGGVATARKGSGTFTYVVRGRGAHAGRDHAEGRNAVAAAARVVGAADRVTGVWPGVTVNVGYVHGGGKTNIVPDSAVVKLNVRAPDQASADAAVAALAEIAERETGDGITVAFTGGFTRPPKPFDRPQQALYDYVRSAAQTLGFDLPGHATGGVSDGNNLYAAGVPNLDNLGVRGGNIHSRDEFMEIDSLVGRSQLAALLLLDLARGGGPR